MAPPTGSCYGTTSRTCRMCPGSWRSLTPGQRSGRHADAGVRRLPDAEAAPVRRDDARHQLGGAVQGRLPPTAAKPPSPSNPATPNTRNSARRVTTDHAQRSAGSPTQAAATTPGRPTSMTAPAPAAPATPTPPGSSAAPGAKSSGAPVVGVALAAVADLGEHRRGALPRVRCDEQRAERPPVPHAPSLDL